uniref:DUF3108 domain-containing protein n=1 Tax=Solibacter usitatus (strain Ellin6076) TaxID=234267 RepID=Q01Q53_SOLUE
MRASFAPRTIAFCSLLIGSLAGDEVPVRHLEGRIHGFLVLREPDGNIVASGVMTQLAKGSQVTNELTFHFKDGSLHQETSVFSQAHTIHLLNYHLVQKGKSFKHPLDMSVDVATGQVAVHYAEDDGKQKSIAEIMKLPADLTNGIVPTLLNDVDFKTPKTTVSMLAATPKPRLVKLEISPAGEDSFSFGGSASPALHYVVKIEIGGISGVIAPVVGKQPPDTHVWMVGGKAPGFLKSEGPLFEGGPIWRIELASPVWPKADPAQKR